MEGEEISFRERERISMKKGKEFSFAIKYGAITKEQAINSEFAVSFLAKNLSENRGSMWTCY